MLEPNDPPLPFPHSSQVEGELRELRCHHGRRLFRGLYRRSQRLFMLLHMFEKTTGSHTRGRQAARPERWDDFRAGMDRQRRRPPRAAGHDAP